MAFLDRLPLGRTGRSDKRPTSSLAVGGGDLMRTQLHADVLARADQVLVELFPELYSAPPATWYPLALDWFPRKEDAIRRAAATRNQATVIGSGSSLSVTMPTATELRALKRDASLIRRQAGEPDMQPDMVSTHETHRPRFLALVGARKRRLPAV